MQPPRLVAVDSNILLSLAAEKNETLDAWDVIRKRLRPVMLLVPPTVLGEIGHQAAETAATELRRLARKALLELRSRWMLQPAELRLDQRQLVRRAAGRLQAAHLIPLLERNDAYILAEAAVLECALLVSEDSHLHGVERTALRRTLNELGLHPPVIATPGEIVRRFYH